MGDSPLLPPAGLASSQPHPSPCLTATPPTSQGAPLVLEKAYIINLNSLFTRYNLRFNATANPTSKSTWTWGEKVRELNTSYPDVPLIGLKSYHLSLVGNS